MKRKILGQAARVAMLLLVLLVLLPGGQVHATTEGGCALHKRHIDWETTTPKVCIWATDVVLTAAQVAQGQTDGTLQDTVLAEAHPAVNYYPNSNGYQDTGSGLSITAADLTAVSAVVPEGSEFVRYTVRLMMDSTLPDERYIEIKLFVLAQNGPCTATSLEVRQQPSKTQYLAGETFDATGMVVMAHFNDGTQADVTAQVTASPEGALALADTVVQLAYGALTATVPITVRSAPVLVSIAVTTPPARLNYVSGTQFDPAGMVVTGYYSDGSSAVLNYTLQGDLTITEQSHTIVIAAGGLTTQFAAGILQQTPTPAPTAAPAPVLPVAPAPTAVPSTTPAPTQTPGPSPSPTPTASPNVAPAPTAVPPSAPPASPAAGQGGQAAQAAPAGVLQVKPYQALFGLSAGSVAGFSALLAPDVYVLLWYQNKKNQHRRGS